MFKNREEAGILLAEKLKELKLDKEAVVLAIPRGGVVVGETIARNLKIPLTLVVVKKLGAPGNSELAIGAIAPDNICYLDWRLITSLDVGKEYLNEEIKRKSREVEERRIKYQVSSVKNQEYRQTILVDDGIATGATTLAAIKYIKLVNPKPFNPKIILAVPVIAKRVYDRLKSEIDEIIALEVSDDFFAVGQFYRNFEQVTDEEVIKILNSK